MDGWMEGLETGVAHSIFCKILVVSNGGWSGRSVAGWDGRSLGGWVGRSVGGREGGSEVGR